MPRPGMGAAFRTGLARQWLAGRCTVESPKAGGGWTTVDSSVPYRRDAPRAVMAWVAGGPVTQQHVFFYLDPTRIADAGLGWRITDEDGVHWLTVGEGASTEDPLTVVDAVRQG